jgi:hypothetical protein
MNDQCKDLGTSLAEIANGTSESGQCRSDPAEAQHCEPVPAANDGHDRR